MSFCFKYNKKIIENKRIINQNILDKNIKKKYIPDKIEKIVFVNKYSVKDDKLLFTNKLQRNNSTRIKTIRKLFSELENDPKILNIYFEGREISNISKNDNNKLKRLDSILKLYNNTPNGELIIKYVPTKNYYIDYNNGKYERGLQLFFTNKDNMIKIYLIDLYHLAIPSKENNLREEYIQVKDYKKDLSIVVFYKKEAQELKELEAVGN